MFVKIKKPISLLNGANGSKTISSGRYEVEEVQNPLYSCGENWIVLKGTTIGMIKDAWHNSKLVIFEE